MKKRVNGFLAAALFGAASLTVGCSAGDVDVSNRGGVRSDTTVESNSSSSTSSSQTQNQRPRSSSSSGATGSGAYSGSTSSGTGSSSRSSAESGS